MTSQSGKDEVLNNLETMRDGAFTKYVISVGLMVVVALGLVFAFAYLSSNNSIPKDDDWGLIGSSVLRLGAVALGVYLTNLLYSFVRYFARMQYHLNSVRNAVLIYNGKSDDLISLHQVLNSTGIDFFKHPASPTEGLTKIIQELAKKVPN